MRRRKKAMERDRISALPQPILHHILSHLSQNDAVKTCVLSKSWRYLWYGRPNVEFCKDDFKGTVENFLSVLEQTLIWYENQNLSIQKFILEMPEPKIDSVSALFLEKWIPKIVMRNKKGLVTFHLSFDLSFREYFDLPSVILSCESLREIFLRGCKLSQINCSTQMVLLRHLQTLRLRLVKVEEGALERIMSSCPLIKEVSLDLCEGLKTENRSKADLTTKSVESFSCNFPCLEELKLSDCKGAFKEFQLSSHSLKRLVIEDYMCVPIKVSIDAPNILEFEYEGFDFPSHISFTTTSNKWKSKISLWTDLLDETIDINISKWLHKLDELLKILSRSETSLHIVVDRSEDHCRVIGDPDWEIEVLVKHLELCLGSQLCSDYSVLYEVEKRTIKKWNSS